MNDRVHIYNALVLWLQAGLFGTFTALNFFHWFMFWELGLIPAFFLVKLWGGPNRGPAATQFFIYTMVGSVALLLSFLAMWLATGSFDFIELAALAKSGALTAKLQAAFGWKNIGLIRVLRRLSGLCGESAGGAVPYLAARRVFRGAQRGRRCC